MAQAPSYTNFEWDIIGLGISVPIGEDQISTGFAYGGEVRFNITDYLSVGVGSDVSLFNLKKFENADIEATVGFSSTSFFSTDYYFKTNSAKRGFVGLAIGGSLVGDLEITDGQETTIMEGARGSSIAPRVGFEYGHARLLIHYNIGLKKELTNYFAFKISLTLWGGYDVIRDDS